MPMLKKLNKVVVYGTLRRGFGNYEYLLNNENAEFLGEVEVDGYTMVTMGGFPGIVPEKMLPKPTEDYRVLGEVFEVTEEVMNMCDRLEGYSSPTNHWYNKHIIETPYGEAYIYVQDSGEVVDNEVVESGDWKEYREQIKMKRLSNV